MGRMVVSGHLLNEDQPNQVGCDRLRDDDSHVRLGKHGQSYPLRLSSGTYRQEEDNLHDWPDEHDRLDRDYRVAVQAECPLHGQGVCRTVKRDDHELHSNVCG